MLSTGPVVRIAPHEVHISDPSCYDVIYSIFSKFYKDPAFYDVLGNEWSTFAIASNEKHRQRRAPLNPFFSRRKVFEMEDIVQEKVAKLCRLVQDGLARGVPVDLHNGFRAISVDVITDYAFDDCWNQLDRDDLGAWYSAMVRESSETFKLLHQFPWIMPMMNALPEWLARRLSSGVGSVFDCIKVSELSQSAVAACLLTPSRYAANRNLVTAPCPPAISAQPTTWPKSQLRLPQANGGRAPPSSTTFSTRACMSPATMCRASTTWLRRPSTCAWQPRTRLAMP